MQPNRTGKYNVYYKDPISESNLMSDLFVLLTLGW